MSHTDEARRAGDAAGLGGSSLFCRCDNPENKPSNHEIQPTNEPRLKYLAARLHDLGGFHDLSFVVGTVDEFSNPVREKRPCLWKLLGNLGHYLLVAPN